MKTAPITLVPCAHPPTCHGFRWNNVDEDRLASIVAWVVVGRFNHAEEILSRMGGPKPATAKDGAKNQAIKRLTVGGSVTAEHRDGWVFQIISWIAACIHADGKVATSVPHYQLASKGFDGLLVPLTDSGTSFESLTVCEDKATKNPRSTITSQVWPELMEVEAGERDSELLAGLTAILQRYQVPDIERLLESVQWEENKQYRVSITASPDDAEDDEARKKLFKGYEDVIEGQDILRRRAETFEVTDLRIWMNQFCSRVIKVVETL